MLDAPRKKVVTEIRRRMALQTRAEPFTASAPLFVGQPTSVGQFAWKLVKEDILGSSEATTPRFPEPEPRASGAEEP